METHDFDLTLPDGTRIRVDIKTGDQLPATDIDPYTLPWVQGAASTLPRQTRLKYPNGQTDLAEKLALLKSKRPARDFDDPVWGPEPRSQLFRSLHGMPPSADGGFPTPREQGW